jgi:hypothetical protein
VLEYFVDDNSHIRSGAIVSNPNTLLELGEKVVDTLSFRTGDANIFGISFPNQSAENINSLLSRLGLPENYEWVSQIGDKCTVIFRCPNLGDVLTSPLQVGKSTLPLQSKNSSPFDIELVLSGKIYVSEDVLLKESIPPPHDFSLVKFNGFLIENFQCGGLIKPLEDVPDQEIDTSSLPILSDRTLSQLPALVQKFIGLYKTPKAKTLAAFSLLAGVSGGIPNVISSHFGKKMWANLYLIVMAPAGRGKNVIDDVHVVMYKIEKWWRDAFKALVDEYKIAMKKFKAGEGDGEPEKPVLRSLFISLDSSSASFFQRLKNNDGNAICIDTEIDSFANNNSKDWGGFSVFLRKAFQFEVIELDRASFDLGFVVEKPKIAMIMAGTFGQFQKLFPDTSDGLYSRCAILTIPHSKLELQNPYIGDLNFEFENALAEIGNKVFEQYQILLNHPGIVFKWSEKQAERLMDFFRKNVDPFASIHNEETDAIILRHMHMVTRFTMTMAVLRSYERCELEGVTELYATEVDLEIAIELMDVSLQHNQAILTMLKQKKATKRDTRNMTKNAFLALLPLNSTISRRESLAHGKANGMPERSVDKYLADLTNEGFLKQIKVGVYRRIK